MFKIRKNRNNVIREKLKPLNWYVHVQRMDKERLPRKIFRVVSTWKTKKGKSSKFVDAGRYNRNERGGN